ncbi:MAG: acyltransferase [Bacteroidales bacterium]|nr:acyltransferase [Bacteroidales bacterium]
MNTLHRLRQVVKYGWQHARQISEGTFGGKKRIPLFFDVIGSFLKYGMWSNQYVKEEFWKLDKEQREKTGGRYRKANLEREEWVKDFYENRRFLAKWSKYEIEASARKREKRKDAYAARYAMGDGCVVEYGVEFSRQHYLRGDISIGKRCTFSKNVFIDYSGDVLIEDGVKMAAGVCVESHHRDLGAYILGKDLNIPTKLHICEGAYIGTHAIILDSCNYIGKYSRIGAGAVVTKDVPDYAVVVGVPAKVVKIVEPK